MDIDPILISGMLTNLTKYNLLFTSKLNGQQLIRHTRAASPWGYTKKEIKELFDDYYKCLNKKAISNQEHNGINAILALEGQTVTMDCDICVRPDQDISHYNIEWQRLTVEDGVLMYVKENDRIKINRKRSLIFKWVDVVDAGQYFCVRASDQEYETIYQLDVLFRERRKTILEKDSPKQLLKDFSLLTAINVENLDKEGKFGLCMVKKINDKKAIYPVDIPIIKLYLNGIPCRSTALPKEIATIRRIKYRRSETIMGNCMIPCPTVPSQIYVTDSSGKG
ncbi:hypothetical protein KUTeg_012942 [Tegillarca granosa]|uniref:Ig-like domain-containing protein n=1 Tax=Tegillarca granosa TaxID=220873 RepID=A0ABQ9EXR8_TEGGR|nr:hypothetical protein KUTeg_012942 [Tegillarca granosa]